ncbi:MAG TPA: squalene--hopene cyclase [Caulobacteraceae bacterium]|jgi:squalene-hopene/tetraprenyl-beta-curcumene cyclase
MDDIALRDRLGDLAGVEAAIGIATEALLKLQKSDGHWVFELEADCTIPAEYVLFVHYLGETANLELERKIGVYLRRIQGEHGGWPLYHGGELDVSATVKAYFALKMIGDDIQAPHMVRAREALLARGGAGACNVFTRILLALFGILSWRAVPEMPIEIMRLPKWFPIHISKISYWARTVIVPLLVLRKLKPRAVNARGVGIDELFVQPPQTITKLARGAHQKEPWASFFMGLDQVLRVAEPWFPRGGQQRAMEDAVEFVCERLNGEDGLGGIFPAMVNSVMMFAALGLPEDHWHRATARRAVEKLLVIKDDEAYCQPCFSPVWDTALIAHALLETGTPEAEAAATHGLEWLRPLQELEVVGDWAEARPGVRPGGWAFQYANPHYPDLDDTAVVVMAMDRARHRADTAGAYDMPIARGAEWVEGLQSKNGGWAAFDADNTFYYLNNIPFADHGALLDPPTVDVAARCVSMLAQLGEPIDSERMKSALAYLEREQLADGSWFGRWGVNYVYGTWSALCALNAAGLDGSNAMVRKAADWLIAIQNPDGGWGENCNSYRLDYAGYEPHPSGSSQTAWALLGLMAAGELDHPAVARGIAWLAEHQGADGFWAEDHYTGGGFPRVFYLRYHGYSKFFPLWALARYRNLKRGNERRAPHGM